MVALDDEWFSEKRDKIKVKFGEVAGVVEAVWKFARLKRKKAKNKRRKKR